MLKKTSALLGVATVIASIGFTSPALAGAVNGDGFLVSDVIFGMGNADGNWTGSNLNNVEVALRGKNRVTGDNNYTNGNTYTFDAGTDPNSATQPIWNFEWSINVDAGGEGSSGLHVGDLTYLLFLDSDPTAGISFLGGGFDPITPPDANTFADHAFGDNSTPNGGGTVAQNASQYAGLLTSSNLVQQSWSYEFFPALLPGFDANAPGIYTIMLTAFNSQQNSSVSTSINIVVNEVSAVPVPAALPLFGTGLAIMGFLGWRRRKSAAPNSAA